MNSLTILGGGPAGLAAAYYARRAEIPFTLYESSGQLGGNARTLSRGPFYFDTGAHRFHNADPEITRDIQALLGHHLIKVESPSQIFHNGKWIDFPLSPLNLLMNLGPAKFTQAVFELFRSKLRKDSLENNFESFSIRTYGKTIAEIFLLNYSEKLWGKPCRYLAPEISAKRMKGLDFRTFIKELYAGKRRKTEHLDGSFYYPTEGIGMIPRALATTAGHEHIRLGARCTRLCHDGNRIVEIEVNDRERIPVDDVISTLPISILLKSLDPSPEAEILGIADSLAYRHLILVVLFLNKRRITKNASLYFPSSDFIFTRVYEPKNRSPFMAPPDKTSLAAEISCSENDAHWKMDGASLIRRVTEQLQQAGLLRTDEVTDGCIERFRHAYPVLEVNFHRKVSAIFNYLDRFENLSLAGRSGRFAYTHIHDLMRSGKELIRIREQSAAPSEPAREAVLPVFS